MSAAPALTMAIHRAPRGDDVVRLVGRAALTFDRGVRSAATVMIAASALFLAPPAWSAFTLDDLMRTLAQRGPESARFVEKKYLAVLDNKPIESSGELRFVPPNRIEKKTVKPKPESLTVDGEQAVVERGNQRHTLKLRDYPDIAPFIDSIRGTLSGDRKALERVYRLEISGDADRWTLMMLPSDAKLATIVQRIDVAGNRDQVRSIAILQGDGDRSVMTIDRMESAREALRDAPKDATKAASKPAPPPAQPK